jgi:hypothetical protein
VAKLGLSDAFLRVAAAALAPFQAPIKLLPIKRRDYALLLDDTG